MCTQSGGLIARAIEEAGVPTVVVMMEEARARMVRPARVLYPRFPYGRPFGEPGNPDAQRVLLEDALDLLATGRTPGEVRALPYRWRREDWAAIRRRRGQVSTKRGQVFTVSRRPTAARKHSRPDPSCC